MTNLRRWNYNENTAKNANGITLRNESGACMDVYYSYDTIVAFQYFKGDNAINSISQNEWKQTTGLHLNWIDRDKKKRIPHNELMAEYRELELQFGVHLDSEY